MVVVQPSGTGGSVITVPVSADASAGQGQERLPVAETAHLSGIDTVPREFAAYAPQLVTLLVLAVASQRLRMPAADGMEYRRGEGD